MYEVWGMAALWLGLALVATLLSIRLRIATALSEIVVGTVGQLLLGVFSQHRWEPTSRGSSSSRGRGPSC
jgi:hypothetical protein